MFPILPEGGSINLAHQHQQQQQQHQMRCVEYAAYALPSGSVFTALPPSPPQQPQSQQRAYLNGNSVLIDAPQTFYVQTQQQQQQQQQQPQKMQTMLSYAHAPSANSHPAGMSTFSNTSANPMPFYTATSIDATSFGGALSMAQGNPSTRTQRMASAVNTLGPLPQHPHQHQQQQQQQQSVHMPQTTSTPPYAQQQQQRGNSISLNSAQYAAPSQLSQQQASSPTPSGSTRGLLFSPQPLSPMSSSSGALQPSSSAMGHITTTSTPSVAYSTPPSSVLQHPQQLVTGTGTAAGAVEVLNSFNAPAATASTQSSAAAAAAVSDRCVDSEEMRQAHERPFRFKMLPPPPTFDRFLQQWEANAADAHYRPWRRGDANANSAGATHVDAADHARVLTEEDVLQRTAAAATATVIASGGGSCGTMRSSEERLALAEQYHRILERWWNYMAVFEQKTEVRQRLGSLYSCPDFAEAQRAVAAGFAEILPGELREQLTSEEVTLQTWSHLVLTWWEETKRRRRTRRSRRGSRRDGASTSSGTGRSGFEDSQVMDDDATTPQLEGDEVQSAASGNSFVLPTTQSGRRTRSLTDNDGYLNFDFTNQTTFGSPAESS